MIRIIVEIDYATSKTIPVKTSFDRNAITLGDDEVQAAETHFF